MKAPATGSPGDESPGALLPSSRSRAPSARAGRDVTLHERAPEFNRGGGGAADLAPTAKLRALAALGLDAELREGGRWPRARRRHGTRTSTSASHVWNALTLCRRLTLGGLVVQGFEAQGQSYRSAPRGTNSGGVRCHRARASSKVHRPRPAKAEVTAGPVIRNRQHGDARDGPGRISSPGARRQSVRAFREAIREEGGPAAPRIQPVRGPHGRGSAVSRDPGGGGAGRSA